ARPRGRPRGQLSELPRRVRQLQRGGRGLAAARGLASGELGGVQRGGRATQRAGGFGAWNHDAVNRRGAASVTPGRPVTTRRPTRCVVELVQLALSVCSSFRVLPGRALSIGESWADTVRMSPEDAQLMEGFSVEMLIATRGTYTGDTIVDGRVLNILRITAEMKAKSSGTLQGMELAQDMTTTSEMTVLWDSA